MNRFFRPAVLLPIIAGLVCGGLLFALGAYDDAPGMCAIGLSAGFILIMSGVDKAGIVKKGLFAPILLFCFGAFIILLTTSILLDGEFEDKPELSAVGYAAAAVLLLTGTLKVRTLCKNGTAKP